MYQYLCAIYRFPNYIYSCNLLGNATEPFHDVYNWNFKILVFLHHRIHEILFISFKMIEFNFATLSTFYKY